MVVFAALKENLRRSFARANAQRVTEMLTRFLPASLPVTRQPTAEGLQQSIRRNIFMPLTTIYPSVNSPWPTRGSILAATFVFGATAVSLFGHSTRRAQLAITRHHYSFM